MVSVELCVIHCFYAARVLSITLGSLEYTKSQTNPAFVIIRALVFLARFPKDLIKNSSFFFCVASSAFAGRKADFLHG